MSRIRSIHPGFFKDDRLVSLTAYSRLLFIGLLVESDDKGVFEWKPVTLKMSIFPADNLDIVSLLSEVEAVDAIRRFDALGKPYGAVRNFRKFQRPKSPNNLYPITDDIRNYVGLTQSISEIDRANGVSVPTKGEKDNQREEGGDSGRSRFGNNRASSATGRSKIYRSQGLIFTLCEQYSGEKVPDFMQSKSFEPDVVARAVMALEDKELSNGTTR